MEITGFRIGFAGTAVREKASEYGFLANAIGKEIARRGHRMVSGGCTGGTTEKCAEGVFEYLTDRGKQKEEDHRIISIIPREKEFTKIKYGNYMISQKYDRAGRRPFMASMMDVLITINGGEGTKSEIEAALEVGTPVVPIWTTGGASHEKWFEIKAKMGQNITPFRYYREAFISNYIDSFDAGGDFRDQAFFSPLAQKAVDIAIKLASKKCGHCFDLTPSNKNNAFVIMPFGGASEKVYSAIKDVFSRNMGTDTLIYQLPADLRCKRADQNKVGKLDSSLQKQIYEASFLIIDLTDNNPNVMFELGIGMGLGKKVIIINQHPEKSAIDLANWIQIPYSLSKLDALPRILVEAINELYKKNEVHRFF